MTRRTTLLLAAWVALLLFLIPTGCGAYQAARALRLEESGRTAAAAQMLTEQIEIEGRGTAR